MIVFTVEVSLMIREVSEPTLFLGLSNQANSFLSTAVNIDGDEVEV